MRAEISGFLQQLRFEVIRKDFNKAALQCEALLSSRLENPAQVDQLLEPHSCALVEAAAGSICLTNPLPSSLWHASEDSG